METSGTIRGTYMRRKDRKAYSYTLSWTRTLGDLAWSATVEGREGSVISQRSGTCDVWVGITPAQLEQMARSAAHAAIESAAAVPSGPKGRLAILRAALRRT